MRSGEEVPPLRQVQNNLVDPSGIRQEHLLSAQGLALAAAAGLQSPENYNLLERGEEVSEAGEQSTASSPRATDDNGEQPARPAMAASPFTPIGSQSTHGSSVGVNTPSLLSLPGATPDGQSGCESNPRQGPASSAPGSGLASRVRATVRHLQARADALRSPGMSPGGLGQLQSAQPCLTRPSYLPSTPSKPWLDVTNVQPHSKVEAGPPSDSPMTSDSHESYNPSFSAPGYQGRKVDPHLLPALGIRRRNEMPRAKAVAAVVSPLLNNPQARPLITTDSQSETVARPWEESPTSSPSVIGIQPREEPSKSVVPPTSPSVIGIQPRELNPSSVVSPISQLTLGIQREAVTPSGQSSSGIQVRLPSIPSPSLPEPSAADPPSGGSAPPLPSPAVTRPVTAVRNRAAACHALRSRPDACRLQGPSGRPGRPFLPPVTSVASATTAAPVAASAVVPTANRSPDAASNSVATCRTTWCCPATCRLRAHPWWVRPPFRPPAVSLKATYPTHHVV